MSKSSILYSIEKIEQQMADVLDENITLRRDVSRLKRENALLKLRLNEAEGWNGE